MLPDEEINPRQILAVLLGASTFPRSPKLAQGRSFYNSAKDFEEYLTDAGCLNLPFQNVCSLFDDSRSANDQLQEIGQFIETRSAELKKIGEPARDFIFYYVGHGCFSDPGQSYSLAIRATSERNEGLTSIRASDLAVLITSQARFLRRFLILDCCFSASAYKEFQSGPLQASRVRLLNERPQRGTTLLCSASARTTSLAPKGLSHTMFSEALLRALRQGEASLGPKLSLSEVGDLVKSTLQQLYPDTWVRPEVHSPDQREGDVASVHLFPNPAFLARKQAADKTRLDEQRNAADQESIEQEHRDAEQARHEEESRQPAEQVRLEEDLKQAAIAASGPSQVGTSSPGRPLTVVATEPSTTTEPASDSTRGDAYALIETPYRVNRGRRVLIRRFLIVVLLVLFVSAGSCIFWFIAVNRTRNLFFSDIVRVSVGNNGEKAGAVLAADLNRDGITDLVTINNYGDDISVLIGKGNGDFQPPVTYPVGHVPYGGVLADVNRDGIPDLVVTNTGTLNFENTSSGTISVLLGKGDGSFRDASTFPIFSNPTMPVVGDFNGDGIPDLAVGSWQTDIVHVYLGNGDGSFRAFGTYEAELGTAYVGVGDFNGDGKLDLVVASTRTSKVQILLGVGDGSFTQAGFFPTEESRPHGDRWWGPYSILVADFNDDGHPDIAVTNFSDNNVGVLMGRGDGTFSPARTFPTDDEPFSPRPPWER